MKLNKPKGKFKTIFLYLNAFLLLLLIGGGTYYVVTINTKGQSCFTSEQVQQDNRCLYIYSNKVYELGTPESPVEGFPCGTDITAVIPASYILDQATLLDPYYLGDVCTNSAVANNALVSPTMGVISTPTPTIEFAATSTLAPSPTAGESGTLQDPTPATESGGIGGPDTFTPTPTEVVLQSTEITETPTVEPTQLTTLPQTGYLEWMAIALIPVALVVFGVVF